MRKLFMRSRFKKFIHDTNQIHCRCHLCKSLRWVDNCHLSRMAIISIHSLPNWLDRTSRLNLVALKTRVALLKEQGERAVHPKQHCAATMTLMSTNGDFEALINSNVTLDAKIAAMVMEYLNVTCDTDM